MMEKLLDRAAQIARSAQRARIEQIAGEFEERGLSPAVGADGVSCRGKVALRAWLSDPLLRFAGRSGA